MNQPEVSSQSSECGIWTMLLSETPWNRFHNDLVVIWERLRAIGLEARHTKIRPSSMLRDKFDLGAESWPT